LDAELSFPPSLDAILGPRPWSAWLAIILKEMKSATLCVTWTSKSRHGEGCPSSCCGDVKTSGGVDDLSLDDPPCRGPGASKKNCWVGLYIFGLPIARKLSGALAPGTRHNAEQTGMTTLRRILIPNKKLGISSSALHNDLLLFYFEIKIKIKIQQISCD
jgi:hypothetical protein